jgi:tripeptide aminopeptidase
VPEVAETVGVRECLAWFARERQWINERHLEFCRIPAPTFREQERAAWFAAQFRSLGCTVKIDKVGNVLAWPGGETDGPFIALTAHLDTVLAPRTPADIQVRSDGRFYGPGVADNGAGLAALLAMAAALDAAPTIPDLGLRFLLVANVCEEGEGNLSGMRYLCRSSALARKIRAFLVLDGPNLDHVTTMALASRRYEISLHGPGGHSWTDFGAGNPVHVLGRVIANFSDMMKDASGPRSSFNFGTIEGGISVNSIPAHAQAKLDLRSEEPARLDEMGAALTLAVEKALEAEQVARGAGRVTAKIREIGARPGGRLPDGALLLQAVRAVDAYLGLRTTQDCSSTDANIPLSMGLEALSLGAGGSGGGAHTASEWFSPEGRDTGLRRILLAMTLMARGIPEQP